MQKRISTITPRGLNTSMPDTSVPDGACEVLHNLRFQNGAWEPVGHFPLVDGGTFSFPVLHKDTIAFLYAHEMDGAVHFIVKAAEEVDEGNNVIYNINLYDCINGTATLIGTFSTINNLLDYEKVDIRVSSFGNVLIVSTKDTMHNYIFSDGKYNLFKMPEPVRIYEDTETYRTPCPTDITDDLGNKIWPLLNEQGDILRPAGDEALNVWWGEICYLVAYRLKDGSIIAPSSLRILCSEKQTVGVSSLEIVTKAEDFQRVFALKPSATSLNSLCELEQFRPSLLITIPEGVDTNIIDRVSLYATRINSIVDYNKITTEFLSSKKVTRYSSYYADNNLPNQPLYLVEETYISQLKGNRWELQLGYHKLKNLSPKSQKYDPVQLHSFVAESMYDYNHRMHYGGLTSTLYSHSSSLCPAVQGEYQEYINIENNSVLSRKIELGTELHPDAQDKYLPSVPALSVAMTTPILSYPDFRATSLKLVRMSTDEVSDEVLDLTPATANNFSYYISPTDGRIKYPLRTFSIDRATDIPAISPTFSEPNRIQVSAVNNIFSLPFENSYAVGNRGSRVVAMNSVADALADSTFYGAYPLYIFTTDGIFALRAGSGQVLYAGTENINHDKIVNPLTIAMNGMVVYGCSEGLKALAERTAARISADIDTDKGAWRDWSKTQFAVNWRYGELLCRMANGELFVWNAAAGAWSTRDSIKGSINGGYAGELVDGELEMYNIDGEMQDDIVAFSFTTRPLKLESVGFKKLEQMIARAGSNAPIAWSVRVEGSNDCLSWRILKQVATTTNQNIGLRHFSQSCRYYRVTISGKATFATISQIDFQLQDRYNNKLR